MSEPIGAPRCAVCGKASPGMVNGRWFPPCDHHDAYGRPLMVVPLAALSPADDGGAR